VKENESRIVLSGEPKSTQLIYKGACRGGFVSYYMSAQGKAIKVAYEWDTDAMAPPSSQGIDSLFLRHQAQSRLGKFQ
jgi:hypothetical protein